MSLQAIDDDGNEARKGTIENKPTINDERFLNGINAILRGEASVKDLENNFALTGSQKQALSEL